MMVMKKFAYIIFAFVFALNTVSLAYAAPCMHKAEPAAKEKCHDMMEQTDQADQQDKQDPQSHCKGVCLCKAASHSHHILPFDAQKSIAVQAENFAWVFVNEQAPYNTTSPPYKPPIYIS